MIKPFLVHKSLNRVNKNARGLLGAQNFTPESLHKSILESRRRLACEKLSGLLLHDPSPEFLVKNEIRYLLTELKETCEINKVGVSIDNAASLKALEHISNFDVLQMPITLFDAYEKTNTVKTLLNRGIRIQVRQIIHRADGTTEALDKSLPVILENPNIDGVVIGLSTENHLNQLLEILDR